MRPTWKPTMLAMALCASLPPDPASAQEKSSIQIPAQLRLNVVLSSTPEGVLLDPEAPAWQKVPSRRVALNRTPPLYDTDPPAALEIPTLEVRTLRAGG